MLDINPIIFQGNFNLYAKWTPMLAINLGNDLATVIREEKVGQVCESNKIEDSLLAEQILKQANEDNTISARCSGFSGISIQLIGQFDK